jgi:hypothetical protein
LFGNCFHKLTRGFRRIPRYVLKFRFY